MNTNLKSWTRTTAGIVGMLLIVQIVSGVLLAFYYVPSVDHAHQTVTFIEKVVSSGWWLRSLHHYGSQWLSLAVFLHVVQLFLNRVYEHSKRQWIAAVLLLALILAGGATGYSLPWDARAFFSTRIGEGLAGGLPFIGRVARLWLLGGADVSTLTLSRLFALHILLTPFLILVVIAWRFRGGDYGAELSRQALAGGVVFLALAVWTITHHAPLGPPISEVSPEYIPRPGTQFLWLYQSLKYLPGGLGSLFAVVVPGLFLVLLLLLPRLGKSRIVGGSLLGVASLLVVSMTALAYLADRNDVRVRAQLQRQDAEEQTFRAKPFEAAVINQPTPAPREPPLRYGEWCAKCHGTEGQGARMNNATFPPLVGVGRRRSVEEIVGILNDPQAYGINPPMMSFKRHMSQQELREIAEWVAQLK